MKHDDPTPAPISGTEPTEPPGSDGSTQARRMGFREPLGENAIEQLRQYQVITMPPSARRALLSAQLPGASPELLYDTLPPNLAVHRDEPEPFEEPEASPAVSPSRQRKLRAIVMGLAVLMLLLVLVAWGRQRSEQAPTVSERSVQVVTQRPAAAPGPAAAAEEGRPEQQIPLAAVSVRPEQSERPTREKTPSTAERSATAVRLQPTREPSVSASAPARSPHAEGATSVPAPKAAEQSNGKRFRLGSR